LGSDLGVVPGTTELRFKAMISLFNEGLAVSDVFYESIGADGTAHWTMTEQVA
jgi:hypothetical protein